MILRCVALLYVLFAFQQRSTAQQQEITLMDFVKIKNGKRAEALYFYEQNWKLYREEAIKKKIIQSYQLLECNPDSTGIFDLILITVYKDSAQYAGSEENFRSILSTLRPSGPRLLNELKPADFRQNVFVKINHTLFSAKKEDHE